MLDTQAPQMNLLRIGEVTTITGVSKTTIYRLMRLKEFPKPVKLGSSAAWVQGEVIAHIEKLKADR